MEEELLKNFGQNKQWCNWRFETDDKGKLTKVPYFNASTKASSTNDLTWRKYEQVEFSFHNKKNNFNGIGLFFTLDEKILGIDLDTCLKDGEIVHEKKKEIEQFLKETDTYAEISPSGNGLHIFLKLSEPLSLVASKEPDETLKTNRKPFEVYTRGRYFTVTFNKYKNIPIRTVSKEEALRLLAIIGYPWGVTESVPVKNVTSDEPDDALVLEKMFASKNGEEIKKLYNGDTTIYRDDKSSADMALCMHLAYWTGGNATQIERLWIKSELANRDKTNVRRDYRPRTVTKAIKNCKEFYKWPKSIKGDKTNDEITFLKSSDIVSKPIDWLWQGKIAKGKVTLIAGDPGLGKSQVTIHLAAIVSNGGMFPGDSKCQKGKVLFFSAEDDPADTINPRLNAVKADGNNVLIFDCVKKEGKEKSFDLSEDIDLLKKTIEIEKGISLIIIDPVSAFLGDKVDSHKNSDVRALLSVLSKVASDHGIAIIVVTHLNKSTNNNPMSKITGSLAFIAAARAGYMVVKDENDERRRLFLPVKNNLAEDVGGFAFRIEGCNISEQENNPILTSRVVWEKEPITMTAIEAMKEQKANESGVDKKTIEKLETILRRYPDGMTTEDYVREAMKVGVSRRTVYRAEKDMFIERVGAGRGNTRLWKLIYDEIKNEDSLISDALNNF